jgi:hypothetical protein
MKELTAEELRKIRESFQYLESPRPHGEIVVSHLLAAMIASGQYSIEEYPRLVEAAFSLNAILVIRFNEAVNGEVGRPESPKPTTNSNPDYDPIPF